MNLLHNNMKRLILFVVCVSLNEKYMRSTHVVIDYVAFPLLKYCIEIFYFCTTC